MATRNVGETGKRGKKAQEHLGEILSGEPVLPFPKDLPEKHEEIWRTTVNTKTGDYWSKGDIPILMMYCRHAWDIQTLSEEIDEEGMVIFNANGNPIVNPKIVIRGYCEAKILSLCTKLRLQPASRMDSKNEANQGVKKRKAAHAAKTLQDDDDGLLAVGGSDTVQ